MNRERSSEPGQSYGFRPEGYNQIVVFDNEQSFRDIVESDPCMVAIVGADELTKSILPGVFIAGLLDIPHVDGQEFHRAATQK